MQSPTFGNPPKKRLEMPIVFTSPLSRGDAPIDYTDEAHARIICSSAASIHLAPAIRLSRTAHQTVKSPQAAPLIPYATVDDGYFFLYS